MKNKITIVACLILVAVFLTGSAFAAEDEGQTIIVPTITPVVIPAITPISGQNITCETVRAVVAELEARVEHLQEKLATAPPPQKPALISAIEALQEKIERLKEKYPGCFALKPRPLFKFPDHAPLQDSIKKSIANGNLTPSETNYTLDVIEKDDKHIKLYATTTITFKNSKEAGLDKWNKIEVKNLTGVEGVKLINPGDYDQQIKDYILQQIQNIPDPTERAKILEEWKNYSYETGERTVTFVETYNVTSPDPPRALSSFTKVLSDPSTTNDVLMGFTLTMPSVDWTVDKSITINVFGYKFKVVGAKAGFKFDGALGLRLPTEVTLNTPDLLIDGSSYTLSTSIEGADWGAAKYSAVSVPPEKGNEFVARLILFLGLKGTIANKAVLDWSIDIEKDYGKSFKTPFGTGSKFPISPIDLSPRDTGLKWDFFDDVSLGIGFQIIPAIGSRTISADWSASGDSIGSGSVEYSEPTISYYFGPVTAGDYDLTTDYANILLNNYKYSFDYFTIGVAANIELHVWKLGDIGTPRLDLFAIDLSSLSDLFGGPYLGIHSGTTADSAKASILVARAPSMLPDLVPVLPPGSDENFCDLSTRNPVVRVRNLGTLPAVFPAGVPVARFEFEVGSPISIVPVDVPSPPSIVTIPGLGFMDFGPIDPPPGCFNPDCDFKIIVDPDNKISESDKANNINFGSCFG